MGKEVVPGFQRFEYRSGLSGLKWKGMRTSGDPASNDPNQPRIVINGRWRGGQIISRDGWAKYKFTQPNTPGVTGCIYSLFGQDGATNKLWIVSDFSCAAGKHGGTVCTYTQDQNPDVQVFAFYFDAGDKPIYLAPFSGDMYVGDLGKIRRIQTFNVSYGQVSSNLGGLNDIVLMDFSIAAPGALVQSMLNYVKGGFLLVGVGNGASSAVWTYDGLTWRNDHAFTSAPLAMCTWRSNAVVGFAGGIWWRDQLGNWTNVVSGGFTVLNSLNSMCEFKDKVYFADGGGHIWSFDGTTLAIAHSPAAASAVQSVCVYNGLLYFCYNTGTAAIIGKYDGTTWIDVEKNLTTQFPNDTNSYCLVPYRGSLFVGMAGTMLVGANPVSQMFACPGFNTSGPWVGQGSLSAPGTVKVTFSLIAA